MIITKKAQRKNCHITLFPVKNSNFANYNILLLHNMILSMTGYGKADAEYEGKKIHVEIKSLNSKSMDLSIRIAPLYREKEMEIRSVIAQALERGKVDFTLWVEKEETRQTCNLNESAISNYIKQIKTISQDHGLPEPSDWWNVLSRMPDVTLTTGAEELSDAEWDTVKTTISEALEKLIAFRKQEGAALQNKFFETIEKIRLLLKQLEPYEKQRTEKIKSRLIENLSNIPEIEYDKNRLEQELIYYIEKLDINEEKQRLTNHLAYFCQTMEEGHGQGKKLGFIAQEMGREINTTGSKSNQAEMQNIVVKMKDELEQIKEQVLNVM